MSRADYQVPGSIVFRRLNPMKWNVYQQSFTIVVPVYPPKMAMHESMYGLETDIILRNRFSRRWGSVSRREHSAGSKYAMATVDESYEDACTICLKVLASTAPEAYSWISGVCYGSF